MERIVRHISDLTRLLDPTAPVVTLFSGGLDSTYLLKLLAEREFGHVTALVVGLGGETDPEQARAAAAAFGATVEYVDRRAEFAERYVVPAIRAHAVYLGVHPVSASLSRPLIAREGVALAGRLGAQAVLHSANPSQNTLRRLNGAIAATGFGGCFGSPHEMSAPPRAEKQRALGQSGAFVSAAPCFSVDANLWCREFESGTLDDPENIEVPEHLYRWSVPIAGAPSCDVSIGFTAGRPTALDGLEMAVTDLVGVLNKRAGQYGIGRYVGLEHLGTRHKVLEAREAPAAAVLLAAYRQLESGCVDAETIREKLHVEQVWVREAVEGRWFGPLREAADAFVASVAQAVSGTVRLRLSPRGADVAAITAERGLYITHREAWEAERTGTALTQASAC